ncbi:hypothetical protein T01_14864 [Trichinella spiralis]|uniref:Uncharacterized protein n=1 Tax=Trichinella spiralis TaxID=6334 RepID=A0A0V1AKX6_TRISP|nr:hypothetical protein T01_13157 [Trichinella spiralis]KRY25412.1 hypothetical protein T01_14864 [Trichinella spiralis]
MIAGLRRAVKVRRRFSCDEDDAGNMKQKWKTKGIQGLPWVPILYVWYEDTSKG